MRARTEYGNIAKIFHWTIVSLLLVQYLLGFLMPDIRRGMEPGAAMNLHISIGVVILALIVFRFAWRIGHPVAPHGNLPRWQRIGSEATHWLLYLLVFVTTLTGWFYASMRGWSVTLFWLAPLPALTEAGSAAGRAIGRLHENMVWVLLVVAALHVAAALVHAFVYRDGVMRRMLWQQET